MAIGTATAQTEANNTDVNQDTKSSEKVYTAPEVRPAYPGGDAALMSFIAKNLNYPKSAYKNKTEGLVIVSFVVDKKGKVTNVEVKRSLDPACDKEAVRVVKKLKKFKPGMANGEIVNVRYTIPIRFQLRRDE